METILSVIPNYGVGGAQRVCSNLNKLLSTRYRVLSVAFNSETGNNLFNNGPVTFLEVSGGSNIFSKSWSFFLRVNRLRKLKKHNNVSFSISHMEGANYVNMLSGLSKNILVVHGTKLHDQDPNTKYGTINRWLIRLLYNYSYKVVTVSNGIKDELINHYGVKEEKILSIPNFFDFEEIKSKSKEEPPKWFIELKKNKKILIHSGRFHPQKNHEALIHIYKNIRLLTDNVVLVLLGDGPLKSKIIDSCGDLDLKVVTESDELNCEADVIIPGNVDNPFSYLSRSNLFLFPSKWEGFPMALCEALICNLRVVTSDCPTGPKEIIGTDKSMYGRILDIPTDNSAYKEWSDEILNLLESEIPPASEWQDQLFRKISKQVVAKRWFDLMAME